jgi:hypothetical protein
LVVGVARNLERAFADGELMLEWARSVRPQ